ncbi:MAG: glycosyltransferase family 9 protein [Phycisphaerae bacterium]
MLPGLPDNPSRILIIKPSALGDVVHAVPVLKLLRRRFPRAHITWLINPGFAPLVAGLPELDEVLLFDRRKLAGFWRSVPRGEALAGVVQQLSAGSYELVLDLQGLLRSAYLASTTRGVVVGPADAREFGRLFYTHAVETRSRDRHAVVKLLDIARAVGCEASPPDFGLALTAAELAEARRLLGGTGPFALLLPGTNWATKRWPADRFAQLVEPLRQRLGLASVVGGAGDVLAMGDVFGEALNLAGRTGVRQLAAVISLADLVISNDSGPMHIAAALGRPLVALFGPTDPARTGPYGRSDAVLRLPLPCSPCLSRRCAHTSCLNWLEVEQVLAAAQRQAGAEPSAEGGFGISCRWA